MISIQVDGVPLSARFEETKTMSELVEIVKTTIDPDAMITSVSFAGESIQEQDWSKPLSEHQGKTLDVKTGLKKEFVVNRLSDAGELLSEITRKFLDASVSYRFNRQVEGSSTLAAAVKDLLVFINWINTLLILESDSRMVQINEYTKQVERLKGTCDRLVQQQLYQAWPKLSEVISHELKSQLDDLRIFVIGCAATR